MDKFDDFYGGNSGYNRRLFLWFLAFVVALFFYNEREGGLFIANANEVSTLGEYHRLVQTTIGENSIIDSSVNDVE